MAEHMSFERWCRENKDLKEKLMEKVVEGEKIDCPHCDGDGHMEMTEYDVTQELLSLYEQQKRADAKKLKDWNDAVHAA